MAEVGGLAASMIQTSDIGIRLSTTLYNFAGGVGRPEPHMTDIAHRVKLTANALNSVGKVFERDLGSCAASKKAVSDAGGLIKRCEAVFGDVQELVEEIGKGANDATRIPRTSGKFFWPLQEQRLELLRRRLEDLTNSLILLLHVLQLANEQAKGNTEQSALAQEREKIRELHQRQQDSLQALQVLESKLNNDSLPDEAYSGSAAPSRVPTIDFLVNSSALGSSKEKAPVDASTVETVNALTREYETSDSDDTVTDDDGEHLTVDELAKCANHIENFLKRITALQQSFETNTAQSTRCFPRNRVQKLYRRFCRKFESQMVVQNEAVPPSAPLPNLVSTSQQHQDVQAQRPTYGPQPQAHHPARMLPDPSGINTDRTAQSLDHFQAMHGTHSDMRTGRPVQEAPHALGTPAYTISSEPLGAGNRPKLPPLISTIPHASQANSINEVSSPGDDRENRLNGTETNADTGPHENSPVLYTKTGRISKAKKGLKVHSCEECGRSFTRAEHLRRHQKNHGPNQVRCELCGKVFFRADLLERHLQRHKDLPEDFRFSAASMPATESPPPVVVDESQHRSILPAPRTTTSGLPQYQSPSDQSVGSSGAPTPLEPPGALPAVVQRRFPSWETTNQHSRSTSSMASVPGNATIQRQNTWQSINNHEQRHDVPENTQARTYSPLSPRQLSHSQPIIQSQPTSTDSASKHKRYSNILPAPVPLQAASMPSSPRDSSFGHRVSNPAPLTPATFSPRTSVGNYLTQEQQYHSFPQGARWDDFARKISDDRASQEDNPGRERQSVNTSTGNISSDKEGVNWELAETYERPYQIRKKRWAAGRGDGEAGEIGEVNDGHVARGITGGSAHSDANSRSLDLVVPQDERDRALVGKFRHEEAHEPPQSPRVVSGRMSHRHNVGPPSSTDPSAASTLWYQNAKDVVERSRSRSVGKPHGVPELMRVPEGPLPPSKTPLTKSTATSHFSKGGTNDPPKAVSTASSRNAQAVTSRDVTAQSEETPSPEHQMSEEPLDPETPYSLASLNRLIHKQGPESGLDRTPDLSAPSGHGSRLVEVHGEAISLRRSASIASSQSGRGHGIKTGAKLPECMTCETSYHTAESSSRSVPAHPIHPAKTTQEPPVTRHDKDVPGSDQVMGHQQNMLNPRNLSTQTKNLGTAGSQGRQYPVGPANQAGGYSSDEDLPSPYLKPRDKIRPAAMIPSVSLDNDGEHELAKTRVSKKRKADVTGEHERASKDTDARVKPHERKKLKGNHTSDVNIRGAGERPGDGEDIVDVLLDQWSVPV